MHLAHRFALASPQVKADMIEATEFPHLIQKFQVVGVPRTVINETHAIEGAVPEAALLAEVMKAVSGAKPA